MRRWRSEVSGLLQSACRIADDMTRRSRANLQRLIIARERVRRSREECLHTCADAKESFKRRAFSRFWDSVQQSSRGAAQFRKSLGELKDAQTTYFEFIKGTLHNFPLRHEGVELDGAVVAAVAGVSDCVRAAESDFEFASILEHKRTQSAVYAGFSQLAAETASLRDSLHDDFSNLLFETREQADMQQESLKRLECIDKHAAASAYTSEQVSAVIEKYRLLA
ncbi:MAG TPA: hypothetical protein VGR95_21545 [Thermoanaerobaculia bacterium]|nr:hypothetical protein [Thermoanaerobaculia bacterium]